MVNSKLKTQNPKLSPVVLIAVVFLAVGWLMADHRSESKPQRGGAAASPPAALVLPPLAKDEKEARERNAGCLSCHAGIESMHGVETPDGKILTRTDEQHGITCAFCHGGNDAVSRPANAEPGSKAYIAAKNQAHVQPRFPKLWGKDKEPQSSGNPQRTFALLNQEKPEFIRFINPGDLRVARATCGNNGAGCHDAGDKELPERIVTCVRKSMMTHGAMLWGAALYNNGSFPLKNPHFGESYSMEGVPQRIQNVPQPTVEQTRTKGILPFLDPLPRWEITQMGNILRVFERGGGKRGEVGIPNPLEEPGRPDVKLSNRGLGTLLRTDPVFLGLQKTRLLDPMLSFLGTNDHPGDYRSSGCTACHVVYANDRDPFHSGDFAKFGNSGFSFSADATIPKNEPGHPIKHKMTWAAPSSQCVSCHHHPGTTVTQSYLGYQWWDNETHGNLMYPKQQRYPSLWEEAESLMSNPEGAAVRGLWSDPQFLANISDLNPKMNRTQFADFHGHGWIFRAVFKQDRKGNLLDAQGNPIPQERVTPEMLQHATRTTQPATRNAPVHLKDIHLEKGMHCVDCHFKVDAHGSGNLYGETRNAVEIDCRDCHGTVTKRISRRTDLKTSGNAAPEGGTRLASLRTPFGDSRFEVRGGRVIQRSMVIPGLQWEVPQVADTIDPAQNSEAAYAHSLLKDGKTWGKKPNDESELAHGDDRMTCYACHSSWMTSCFGCHLKMQANKKMPQLHNEGGPSRNWTSYNFQTLRDDAFMLGKDGTVTGHRVAPVRSACAIYVSSQNQNREWIYFQQQTVSAEGFSGHAFSPHVPHTVGGTQRSGRKKETKQCTDCHISARNDNNAWMAQILMHGTNLMNFMGRYVYVAEGHKGFEAVVVTEREEPQAVIGSRLHEVAYPDNFRKHQERGMKLKEAYHHHGDSLNVQLRGEYLYSAEGERGLWVYDVANVDNKGFSERMVTAPVSPWGQKFYVKTQYATAVAAPATVALDPARTHLPENEEQPIHPLYAYLYVTDKYEGLILVNAATLLDGNPMNNFLKRALTFNPNGVLNGAVNLTIAGNYAYVCCARGLVVVHIGDPLKPQVVAEVGAPAINKPRAVAIQFRYAFVCDEEGVKVVEVTFPERPRPVGAASVALPDARNIYLARTYAYVAAGKQGLVILDIERPEQPKIDQIYHADGALNDVNDVKVAITNASVFAYVADGHNGLRVLQLTSPEDTPGYLGFSPRPTPRLIATYHTHGPALAISEGVDRDRGVDESGNQVGVFGRRGARPFNLEEQRRMYLRNGQVYTVTDEPPPVSSQQSASQTVVAYGLLPTACCLFIVLRARRRRGA